MPSAPASDHLTPSTLWEAARDVLGWLFSLCGAPVSLAGCIIMPIEREEILYWLRPVEALVRRLLLIEAAALAPGLEPGPARRGVRQRRRRVIAQDMCDAGTWRVAFTALPQRSRTRSTDRDGASRGVANGLAKQSDAGPATRQALEPSDAWPLAERMEAVARVLADPAPFARRLAFRLRRRPASADCLVRTAGVSPYRGPADTALAEASAQAVIAVRAFDTS